MNPWKKDWQQNGFVRGFEQRSFTEANRQLASARQATPPSLRDEYYSQIRKEGNGYAWYWTRK